jgi:hypothetical protein
MAFEARSLCEIFEHRRTACNAARVAPPLLQRFLNRLLKKSQARAVQGENGRKSAVYME